MACLEPMLSRRQLLAASPTTLPLFLALSACKGPAVLSAPPTVSPQTQVLLHAMTAELNLIWIYNKAIAAYSGLAPALAPLRAEHEAHLARLRGRVVEPPGKQVPSTVTERPALGATQARRPSPAPGRRAGGGHDPDEPAGRRLPVARAAVRVDRGLRGDARQRAERPDRRRVSASVAALQGALAAEHAAVYGYGVVGAMLAGTGQADARTDWTAHQVARDNLATMLTGLGATPVAASPAYQLPFAVTSAQSAARLAATLEEGVTRAYLALVAVATRPCAPSPPRQCKPQPTAPSPGAAPQ